jgi:hypothetical protein
MNRPDRAMNLRHHLPLRILPSTVQLVLAGEPPTGPPTSFRRAQATAASLAWFNWARPALRLNRIGHLIA